MIESLLFVILLFALYVIASRRMCFISLLRYLCILAGIFIFLAFWISLLDLGVNLATLSAILVFLIAVVGFMRFTLKKDVALFDEDVPSLKKDGIIMIFPILAFLFSIVVGSIYFGSDFSVPQYVSPDPAVHFLLGKKLMIDESIQYFSRSIFFPDSVNIHTYPYGSAVMIGVFMDVANFWETITSYQVFNVLILALVNAYGFYVLRKMFGIKSMAIALITFLLMSLGFYLNLMIIGFTSQLAGLLFVFFALDIYISYKWSWKKVVLLGLGLSAVMLTYFYWVPIVLLFMGIDSMKLIGRDMFRKHGREILYLAASFIVFLLLSLQYFYLLYTSTIVGVVMSSDGLAYRVFLANFIVFVPFLLTFIYLRGKEMPKGWGEGFSFLISCLIISGTLALLFKLDRIEMYTFAKGFPLTIPVIYWASMKGVEMIHTSLQKNIRVFTYSFLVVISWLILTPFVTIHPEHTFQNALPLRVDDLNVRIFDVFFYNGQSMVNPGAHMYSLDPAIAEFSRNIQGELESEGVGDKVSVIGDGDRALWFYVYSDIWPRDIEERLLLWVPNADYSEWIEARNSDILILLDVPLTWDWVEESGFEWESFEVVYSYGNNYALRYVGK